jgi:hypothetical protein
MSPGYPFPMVSDLPFFYHKILIKFPCHFSLQSSQGALVFWIDANIK